MVKPDIYATVRKPGVNVAQMFQSLYASFRHECKAGLKVSFKQCKGRVKLIKFQIYASFTSALHRSKVMFSCCVCSRQVNVVCVTPTEW